MGDLDSGLAVEQLGHHTIGRTQPSDAVIQLAGLAQGEGHELLHRFHAERGAYTMM